MNNIVFLKLVTIFFLSSYSKVIFATENTKSFVVRGTFSNSERAQTLLCWSLHYVRERRSHGSLGGERATWTTVPVVLYHLVY